MKNVISDKVLGLQPSGIRKFFDIVSEMDDVISLGVGEPDFDTPKRICDELKRQVDAGFTHYTVGRGLPELRRKITEKLKEENGCSYSPDEIMVTPGGKYAVYLAVRGLVNPGDEVIYLEPGWISYPAIIQASSKDC